MHSQASLQPRQHQLHAQHQLASGHKSPLPPRRALPSSRSRCTPACRASAVLEAPTWTEIEQKAGSDVLEGFVVRPGQAPGTAPHSVIPTARVTESPNRKPIILYRDGNSWCPSCERVWMGLLEKNIPFDAMFISLYNKPDWYPELVPTTLVPAVSIRGRVVWESYDILKELDKEFPANPLFPTEPELAEQAEALSAAAEELSKAGYSFLLGREGGFGAGTPDESRVPEFRVEFEQHLSAAEAALDRHSSGPFFLGDFSHVDLMFMPALERFAANIPFVRGMKIRGNLDYPLLDDWFEAMDAKPSYQAVKSDDKTHHLLANKIMRMPLVAHEEPVDDVTQRARREAAAKLNINRKIIVRDCALRSGVFTDVTGINGYPAAPSAEVTEAVDFALRRMATYLLTGRAGDKHPEAHGRAVGAATLSYFRNRASSPRDMSAAAAAAMRAACDAVLRETY